MSVNEQNAHTYLTRLADEFAGRGWTARVQGQGDGATLQVTNPSVGRLTESVRCVQHGSGWTYSWPWDQAIGPADDLAAVADRIQHVLREAAR